jgi:hypothetical protein
MALGEKAGSQWCSKGGIDTDPKTLINGDTTFKHTAKNPHLVDQKGNGQLVAIWNGQLQHIESFFDQHHQHMYRNVENIILMAYGMEDLCRTAVDGTHQIGSDVARFLKDYGDLVNDIHEKFPAAIIITSDPLPRETAGFGNARASDVARRIAQCNPMHHHINLARAYYQHRSRQLRVDKYESDGIRINQDQVTVLIKTAHEALDKIKAATDDIKNALLFENGFILKF